MSKNQKPVNAIATIDQNGPVMGHVESNVEEEDKPKAGDVKWTISPTGRWTKIKERK